MSNFVDREALREDFGVRRIIQGNPEEQIISGNILGPLKVIARTNLSMTLQGNGIYFSRFRAGDPSDIAIIDKKTKKLSVLKNTNIAKICFPSPGLIEVTIRSEVVDQFDSEIFLVPKSQSVIKKSLRRRLWELGNFNQKAERLPINRVALKENFNHMSEHLNSTQKEALKFLVDNDLKGLVQGPPGTGKTQLLIALVNLAVNSGVRVGLTALTHSAVDNALSRIVRGGGAGENVFRVSGNRGLVKSGPYGEFDIDSIYTPHFLDLEGESSLFAATIYSWCMSNSPAEIDLLIIDEASQIPFYFYPFLEKLAPRVIMFGDHQQLPPVLQVKDHNLPAEDIFSFEISQAQYPMLEIQYRMNEGVQEWSSNRFYAGKLRPSDSNKDRDVLKGKYSPSGLLGPGAVNLYGHDGSFSQQANPIEAKKVAELVKALKQEGNIPLNQIGVVTPYRAQAGSICAALQDKLGVDEAQKILVDTVERFQGQEREAMILSMSAEMDESARGAKTFLSDGRRLNVSVTRARSRFYCLAPNKLIKSSIESPKESHLKSFFQWCGKK